jgi:hypothetical protein
MRAAFVCVVQTGGISYAGVDREYDLKINLSRFSLRANPFILPCLFPCFSMKSDSQRDGAFTESCHKTPQEEVHFYESSMKQRKKIRIR